MEVSNIRMLLFTGVCGNLTVDNGRFTYDPPALEGKYIGGTTATLTCDWSYKVVGKPYICRKISGVWSWGPESGHPTVCAGAFTFVDGISPFCGTIFTHTQIHLDTDRETDAHTQMKC